MCSAEAVPVSAIMPIWTANWKITCTAAVMRAGQGRNVAREPRNRRESSGWPPAGPPRQPATFLSPRSRIDGGRHLPDKRAMARHAALLILRHRAAGVRPPAAPLRGCLREELRAPALSLLRRGRELHA